MALDLDILEADLRAVISDIPVELTINGVAVSGMEGNEGITGDASYMGVSSEYTTTVSCVASDVVGELKTKTKILVSGEPYIIQSFRMSADKVQYVIACVKESAELSL